MLLERLREMIAPMRARIGDERLRWLKTFPAVQAGDGFAVVHASPKDLWRAPKQLLGHLLMENMSRNCGRQTPVKIEILFS